MSLGAPLVYIGTQLMNDHALAKAPMLADLSFTWGTDSQTEYDDPATCSAQLLVREPADLSFLVKGAPFGLLDPGSGETLFAGRVSTLKAKRDKRKKKALLISITAADTQADLAGYRVESATWIERASDGSFFTSATRRREQLRSVMPAGWVLEGTTRNDWHNSRPQVLIAEPLLPLVDRHARTVIGRRHFTSRYVPGAGLLPRVTITDERSKTAPAETLQARANGQWFRNPTSPANSAHVQLDASTLDADTEWEKTPDDTVTDVALNSWGSVLDGDLVNQPTASLEVWVAAYLRGYAGLYPADLLRMQAEYGYQQVTVDTDAALGSPLAGNPMVENIVKYWLDADTLWRPTALMVPDSRKIHDDYVLGMISATRRHMAYVSVSRLQENTPAGGSRVRGFILGGTATWTGKKWQIELTLGRVPRPAGGGLTFDSIRWHTNGLIKGGTAETVGTELTFADFEYIGA